MTKLIMVLIVAVTLGCVRMFPTASEPPVDVEHMGSEAEYTHGDHCIDSRSF